MRCAEGGREVGMGEGGRRGVRRQGRRDFLRLFSPSLGSRLHATYPAGNMLCYTAKMALFFLSSHGEDVNIFHFRVEHKNKQQTKCEIHAKK
jgi:hypothetical protein